MNTDFMDNSIIEKIFVSSFNLLKQNLYHKFNKMLVCNILFFCTILQTFFSWYKNRIEAKSIFYNPF